MYDESMTVIPPIEKRILDTNAVTQMSYGATDV
jgi:hypothetical protein